MVGLPAEREWTFLENKKKYSGSHLLEHKYTFPLDVSADQFNLICKAVTPNKHKHTQITNHLILNKGLISSTLLQCDSQREIQFFGYLGLTNEDLPLAVFVGVTVNISGCEIQTNLEQQA